jgi:uncharacterized protein (TIGR00369 family)
MKEKHSKFDLDNYAHRDEFGKWLGYKALKIDKKKFKFKAELVIRKDHLSPAGRVHGGVVSSFLDYACGGAVFTTLSKKDFCSTVELKVNYFKPLMVGDHIQAATEVIFRGKKLCVAYGFAYKKGSSAPVAMVTATFNIVSFKKF